MSGSRTLLRPLRLCVLYHIQEREVCLPYGHFVIQASPAAAEPFAPQPGVIEQNEMFDFALKSAPSVLYSKYKQFGQVRLPIVLSPRPFPNPSCSLGCWPGVRNSARRSMRSTTETPPQLEPLVRPKEHATVIPQQIDRDLAKVKERDHGCWDDQVEVSWPPSSWKSLDFDIVIELVAAATCPPLPVLLQGFQELSPIRRGFSSTSSSGCHSHWGQGVIYPLGTC